LGWAKTPGELSGALALTKTTAVMAVVYRGQPHSAGTELIHAWMMPDALGHDNGGDSGTA
jgi:hypothetical protein